MTPWGMLAWIALGTASAACPTPYSLDSLVSDLGKTELGNREGTATIAGEGAAAIDAGLPCLDTTLPKALTARLYRSLGAGSIFGGHDGEGWLATAVELEPSYAFGVEELSPGHPAVAVFAAQVANTVPEPVPLTGRQFGPGVWRLDGRLLTQPEATVDRPHVLQQSLDGDVHSWAIEGNQFPAEVLVAATLQAAKSSKKARVCKGALRLKSFIDSEGNYCPATPPEQVVLVLSGPLMLGAAAGLYAESFRQKRLTMNAPDLDALAKHRAINNRLYVASVGTAAVGVGLGVFGLSYTGQF